VIEAAGRPFRTNQKEVYAMQGVGAVKLREAQVITNAETSLERPKGRVDQLIAGFQILMFIHQAKEMRFAICHRSGCGLK